MASKATLCILFLFVIFLPARSADVEFSASVDAETIGLEDNLIYTISFKGIQNPAPPDISAIGDFNVIQTSRSSEFKFINGVSSSYINFIYYLAPLKEGVLSIPPLKYVHNNKVFKTKGFRIVAVKGSIKPAAPQNRRRSLFDFDEDLSPFESLRNKPQEIDVVLKAVVSNHNAKIGEQLIYRVLLYSRNRIESVNLISGQSFPGFWQEWYPVEKSIDGSSEIIDGKNYQVYEIRKAALFPSNGGTLLIPPVSFELSLSDNSFSFFSAPRKITRSTNSISIKVENSKDDQKGLPVGNMKITAKPDKNSIDINEILTVRIEIRGFGNIKVLKIPEYVTNDYFKVFPSKISRDINYEKNGIYGVVSAEVPLSFKKTGLVKIPSLRFKYYDPVSNKIKVSLSREFSIEVTGSRENFSSGVNSLSRGVSKKGSDIDFIMKGSISDQNSFIYRTTIYRILILIIIIFIISIPVYEYIIKIYILGNKIYQKKRVILNLLKKLEKIKDYGEVFQVIEEYLEEKTGIRRSEINSNRIEDMFYSSGISKNDTVAFLRIRAESELSRFSPSTIRTVSQVNDEIEELKKILKKIDPKLK